MPWESWIKPENCPGPCTGCEPGDHHWMEDSLDPANEDDQGHPALVGKTEDVMVMVCKHCDAWREMTDADFEDEDGESLL